MATASVNRKSAIRLLGQSMPPASVDDRQYLGVCYMYSQSPSYHSSKCRRKDRQMTDAAYFGNFQQRRGGLLARSQYESRHHPRGGRPSNSTIATAAGTSSSTTARAPSPPSDHCRFLRHSLAAAFDHNRPVRQELSPSRIGSPRRSSNRTNSDWFGPVARRKAVVGLCGLL